jgi:membrane protein DedA with SNARE-associated domain/rhodanese-related sulfurtransferase
VTAVSAALIADLVWFWAGRRYGRKVLTTLCRISLSPTSCVSQTESIFARWGAPSLVVAKFVPGFASVASVLAGTNRMSLRSFLLFDGLGATIWAGTGIYLGFLFSTAIEQLLQVLEELGKWGLFLGALALAAFIGHKWLQRRRFMRSLRMARISVKELRRLQLDGLEPLVIDVRSMSSQRAGRIPGAVAIPNDDIETFVLDGPDSREVVLYCSCPSDASAAVVAKKLMQKGVRHVRPLAGGIDAWVSEGHALEEHVIN